MQPDTLHFTLPSSNTNPDQCKMYDTLRCIYYWSYITNDFFTTFGKSESCVIKENRHRHKCIMKLFLATWSSEFVDMDLLGPLPKTTQINQYFLAITYWYSKLTHAISTSNTTYAHTANVSLDHCLVPCYIPAYLLRENSPRFVSILFSSTSA